MGGHIACSLKTVQPSGNPSKDIEAHGSGNQRVVGV
jgi:hypothetical protein